MIKATPNFGKYRGDLINTHAWSAGLITGVLILEESAHFTTIYHPEMSIWRKLHVVLVRILMKEFDIHLGGCTILVCTKTCGGMNGITTKLIFHRIRITIEATSMKWIVNNIIFQYSLVSHVQYIKQFVFSCVVSNI